MKNLHGVEFKTIHRGDFDYRVESYQGGIFWTDRSFETLEEAVGHKKTLSEYYERKTGAFLFVPTK